MRFNEHAALFANLESKRTNTACYLAGLALKRRCACTGTRLGPVGATVATCRDKPPGLTRPLYTTALLTDVPPKKRNLCFPGETQYLGAVMVLEHTCSRKYNVTYRAPVPQL